MNAPLRELCAIDTNRTLEQMLWRVLNRVEHDLAQARETGDPEKLAQLVPVLKAFAAKVSQWNDRAEIQSAGLLLFVECFSEIADDISAELARFREGKRGGEGEEWKLC